MRVALVSLLLLVAASAEAGRRRFGWSYDTETVPERGVELETWLTETTGDEKTSWVRWMTVFGLTETLELALPIDLVWRDLPAPMRNRTAFEEWGAELRWRLAKADPMEAGPFVPLVRLGLFRHVIDRDALEVEGNLVLSLAAPEPLYFVLDLGAQLIVHDEGDPALEAYLGFGLEVEIVTDLRFGAELTTEHAAVGDEEHTWLAAGPVASYTHGRLWLVASLPIGVSSEAPDLLPRILWGIAF